MKRFFFVILIVFAFISGCSGPPSLTPDVLSAAQEKWKASRPAAYKLQVEMSGDRVETGKFEVTVEDGKVTSLRRNGLSISPNSGQDYSMEGLFHVLQQELGLAEKPAMLGAPEGYSVYMNARFDDQTGRLVEYRRTVGGASNSIEIKVLEFLK